MRGVRRDKDVDAPFVWRWRACGGFVGAGSKRASKR